MWDFVDKVGRPFFPLPKDSDSTAGPKDFHNTATPFLAWHEGRCLLLAHTCMDMWVGGWVGGLWTHGSV